MFEEKVKKIILESLDSLAQDLIKKVNEITEDAKKNKYDKLSEYKADEYSKIMKDIRNTMDYLNKQLSSAYVPEEDFDKINFSLIKTALVMYRKKLQMYANPAGQDCKQKIDDSTHTLQLQIMEQAKPYIFNYFIFDEDNLSKDGLTGAYTHEAFEQLFDKAIELAEKSGIELSVVYIDMKEFKRINDTLGHGTGDKTLNLFGIKLLERFGGQGIVGRLNKAGDEFAIVLPNMGKNKTNLMMKEFVGDLNDKAFDFLNDLSPLKFNAGISTYPNEGRTQKSILTTAEKRMFIGKKLNGNQIVTNDTPS